MTRYKSEKELKKALRNLKKSTLKINTRYGEGTGFFIGKKTIATCLHVVEDCKKHEIEIFWDGKKLDIELIESNAINDLALIIVSLNKHPYVDLNEKIELGDKCYSFGFPENYKDSGDPISFEYEGTNDKNLKFKDGQFEPGFSGSPILNLSTLQVFGIIKRTRDEFSNLGGRGIAISKLFVFEQFKDIKYHQELKAKNKLFRKNTTIFLMSLLAISIVIYFANSILWATKNNLPFGYVFIKPLWELGIYSPTPAIVKISSGSFTMGCLPKRDGKDECDEDEKPSHIEHIKNDFWIGKYEVKFIEYDYFIWSQKEWINNYPHANYGGRYSHPVINVNWYDAIKYTKWLSKKTLENYQLPSEKQWEYAARSNSNAKYYWEKKLAVNYANCKDCKNEVRSTTPVGEFKANNWGIYDIAGNVWEWTRDSYNNVDSNIEEIFGPISQAKNLKVMKGGSYLRGKKFIRPSEREAVGAINGGMDLGFRIIKE